MHKNLNIQLFCGNITTFRIQQKIHKSVVFGGDGIPKSHSFNSCYTNVVYANFV